MNNTLEETRPIWLINPLSRDAVALASNSINNFWNANETA